MISSVKLSSIPKFLWAESPFPDVATVRLEPSALGRRPDRGVLSENERRLLVHLVGEKRRYSFVAGRLAAKNRVGRLLGLPPETLLRDIDIGRTGGGIPTLAIRGVNISDATVSISHGGDFAMADAVRSGSVGVDVEPVSKKCVTLKDAFAAPEEIKILMDSAEGATEATQLTRLFSAKEAAAKCLKTHLFYAFHYYRLIAARRTALVLKDISGAMELPAVETVLVENHVFSRLLSMTAVAP